MSHVPQLEPVVLITSVPPGSAGRKNKRKEQSALVGGSGKKTRVHAGPNLGSSIPSAQVEVLLPPLGSWKNRLFGSSDKVRFSCALPRFMTRLMLPAGPLSF
jgi:hypothetical protein